MGCHSAISRTRKPLALRHDNAPATGLFAFRHLLRESLYAPRIFAHPYLIFATAAAFPSLPRRHLLGGEVEPKDNALVGEIVGGNAPYVKRVAIDLSGVPWHKLDASA